MKEQRIRIKYITVGAMLSALGVVLLALGSLIEVLDLTTAVLASFLCIYAVIEMKGAYPWMIWLVTSFLSLLLLPQKTPAIFYAMFAGFYPIVKEKLEKLSRLAAWICKLAVFHLSLGAMILTLRIFFPTSLDMSGLWWMPLVLYLMALVCFVLLDVALSRLITFYILRLRNRFRIK